MENSPIIEKIRKLLALSNSSNEHEAALAASHAQRLLSEHNLAMTDVVAKEQPQSADRVETSVSKTVPKWLRQLSYWVSNAFDCNVIYNSSQGKMTFIGVGADVQIALYTFTYLDSTIRKLCSGYMKQHIDENIAKRHRELMRQSYYLGAVSTIGQKLREQKVQTPITPGALVPVKQTLIKKAMDEMGPIRTIHSRRSYINSLAYKKGQQDGLEVSVNKGIQNSADSKVLIS